MSINYTLSIVIVTLPYVTLLTTSLMLKVYALQLPTGITELLIYTPFSNNGVMPMNTLLVFPKEGHEPTLSVYLNCNT